MCRAAACPQGAHPGPGEHPARFALLRAREPIFSKSHTNEFCGIGKSTPEPAGPCRPLRPGRWVYEKGAGRAAAGLGTIKSIAAMVYWVVPRTPAAFCWSLASPWCSWRAIAFLRAREPIFSKTHTNEFCGIGKSTPQPAGPWDPLRPGRWVYEKGTDKLLWGGCRGTALAPLHGSLRRPLLVPFHPSPLSRGALRSAGVPTIAASTTPAPRLPWLWPGLRGIWEDSAGAREYPVCAEGWALWVIGGSPDLLKATGGTYRLGMPQG
jgi:hypothetical protein